MSDPCAEARAEAADTARAKANQTIQGWEAKLLRELTAAEAERDAAQSREAALRKWIDRLRGFIAAGERLTPELLDELKELLAATARAVLSTDDDHSAYWHDRGARAGAALERQLGEADTRKAEAERDAALADAARLREALDDHVPSGGEGMDGYGYVTCSCGEWISDSADTGWPEHILAANPDATSAE